MKKEFRLALGATVLAGLTPFGAGAQHSATTLPPIDVTSAAAPHAAGPDSAAAGRDSVPVLVYSVNRTPDRPFSTSRQVTVITSDDIRRRNPRTFYDLLREAGVYMSQTANGGTSQVASMRGWEGKNLLVLVDGVQVNNTMYRFNLQLIDPLMIERVEIVKGVGSVLGSEALGGIINVITKAGPAVGETGALHASVTSRFQGGTVGAMQRADVYGQTERFRYRIGGTYQDNGHTRPGANYDVQAPSRYVQRSANGSADWFLTDEKTLNLGFWGRQMRPHRTDRYLDRTFIEYYEPELEQNAHLRYTDMTDRGWTNMLQITAYYHRDDEDMQRIDVRTPDVRTWRPSEGNLLGLNVELGAFLGERHRLIYGVDVTGETIDATQTSTNLSTGAVTTSRGRYTDGSTFRTAAVYIQDRFQIGERFHPTVGLRWAHFRATGYENTSFGEYNLDGSNSALSASLNTLFEAAPSVHLVANLMSGFRAPNIDDLSSIERRITGLEVPNPALRPEYVTTAEAGLKIARPRYTLDAIYFYSYATDVIKRWPGTYRGLSYIDSNNNGTRDPGELDVIQKQNVGTFEIQGPEVSASVTATPTLRIYGNYQFLVGRDVKDDTYLFRLPPAYGTNGGRWTPKTARAPWIEVVHNWALDQKRLSPEDSIDKRIGPDGTEGYNLFSLRAGVNVLPRVPLRVAAENVFNQRYQYHGTATYEAGREIVMSLGLEF